ncbi:MAG: efflux RND transporter periplasmic adaptor subunit [Terriglobia bacterium]
MKILILLISIVVLAGCSHPQGDSEPKTVVEVKVTAAQVVDVQLSVVGTASIYPWQQASIASKITAPIRTLVAKKGDSVAAGQVLAYLENRDLVAQRVESLERARADAASTEAVLGQAQKNLDRRQRLYKQGAITARELLASQTELAQARASYNAAHKYLDLIEGSTSRASDHGSAVGDPPQTAFLNTQIEFTKIRSPFAGVVIEQFLYPGDMAKPDSPIFTLMDLSVAVARAQIPETQVAGVARGQACFFESGDLPDRRLGGRVSVVNQAVDLARRTVEVWCEIPNRQQVLRAGVFGSVTVSVGTAPHAVVLPESAVQFKEGSAKGTSMVVDHQHVAHLREVEAIPLPGGKVRVIRGIEAGEVVVTEGGYGLPNGTQVTITDGAK